MKECQFCGTSKNVLTFCPGGCICVQCEKNLDLIRKLKLGIPVVKKGRFKEGDET